MRERERESERRKGRKCTVLILSGRQTRQQQVFQQQMRTHDKELAELNQRLEARKNGRIFNLIKQ